MFFCPWYKGFLVGNLQCGYKGKQKNDFSNSGFPSFFLGKAAMSEVFRIFATRSRGKVSMIRRLLWLVLLLLPVSETFAGRDSLLWSGVREAGLVYRRGQVDSALAQALTLLPVAKEQGNSAVQAMLHVIIGLAHGEKGDKRGAIDEYGYCVSLSEANNFLSLARQPKYQFLFQTMIPTFVQQALLCDEQGLEEQSLTSAKTALKWMECCNNESLYALSMPGVSEILVKHGEYRLAYQPTRKALKWCAAHGQQALAKGLLASLVVIETALGIEDQGDTTTGQGLSVQTGTEASVPATEKGPTVASSAVVDSTVHSPQSLPIRTEYVLLRDGRLVVVGVALGVVVLLFTFYILRQRHQQRRRSAETVQQMEERFIEGQESERARLARELHDNVSNQLLAVEMRLNSDGLTPQTMQLLNESREQVRRVSHELLPPEFRHASLCQVVRGYADGQDGLNGCRVIFMSSSEDADWTLVPAKTALEVYRIMQEAVANAQKHAGATTISIGLHLEDGCRLTLTVSDDGAGNDKRPAMAGIGLRTMGQRADAIGGHLDFFRYYFGNTVKLTVEMQKSL